MMVTARLLAIVLVGCLLAAHVQATVIQVEDAHLVVHGCKFSFQLLNLGLKQLLLITIDLVFELDLIEVHAPQLLFSFALLLKLRFKLLDLFLEVLVFLLEVLHESNFFFKFALQEQGSIERLPRLLAISKLWSATRCAVRTSLTDGAVLLHLEGTLVRILQNTLDLIEIYEDGIFR
jgi:hypothetical protein